MAVLAAAVSALSTFYQDSLDPFDPAHVELSTDRLLAKIADDRGVRTQEGGRPAVPVSRQHAELRRQLPAADLRGAGRGV